MGEHFLSYTYPDRRSRLKAGRWVGRICLALFLLLVISGSSGITAYAEEKAEVYVTAEALYDYAYQVLDLLNEERTKAGLNPLSMDVDLLEAAMQRAADNVVTAALTGSMAHERPDGSDFWTVSDKSYGENIAGGMRSPEDVMQAWMNSEGHRDNMLTEEYISVGIGCVKVGSGYYYFWAQEFGLFRLKKGARPENSTRTFAVPVSQTDYDALKAGTSTYAPYISLSCLEGWQKDASGWRYYTANAPVKGQWLRDGSSWFYLNSDGYMVTGWQKLSGIWYYFDGSGRMAAGWKSISGKWYYFQGNGAMTTGWRKINGSWYYFSGNGDMATGWKSIGGSWYFFKSSGEMKTGWLQRGGKWYFLKESGEMAVGSWTVRGTEYLFDENGVCLNP